VTSKPLNLFMRTALLMAGALCLFSIIAWQVIVWTSLVPAAEITVQQLLTKAHAAIAAHRGGDPLPEDTRFENGPAPKPRLIRGLAFNAYVEAVRGQIQRQLESSDVRIARVVAPSEIWVKMGDPPDTWLVLSWRFAGPRAPMAALGLLGGAALIVLVGAALSARKLTAPLAALSVAAGRVAEGHSVAIDASAGPGEVRDLAVAFQSMSTRLAELDEQRELMLGGISHDLRTPLTRIRVAVELLEGHDPALIAEMAASVEEMDRMIGQFLRYVRSNYREVPTEAVIDDVVRETLAIFATDDRVQVELSGNERRRFAVDCLRHSLLNLVQNALEYGQPPVMVRTVLKEKEIVLSVHDRGAGLSQMQWIDALRPFHRLNTEPAQGHSGLGLALVQRLVSGCDGTLESRQSSTGFTITVHLPVSYT
jgi:two-component system, OmpR family, osmolarity sensor histidine kinase EnvZ